MEGRDLIKTRSFVGNMVFVLLSLLLFVSTSGYAYEVPIHKQITNQAVTNSIKYSNFVNNLQLDRDIALKSIVSGSKSEDDWFINFPIPCRCTNHFFDPTTGLGLNIHGVPIGKPSLQWGLSDTSLVGGNAYSWTKAREYMYIALTGKNFNGDMVAATADERNGNFQLMFRSVGQVMHLVEDLASPPHVRNDQHLPVPFLPLTGDLYEKLTVSGFDPNWLTGYQTVPLSQFSDPWTSPQSLAIFTNSNFISQGTNFIGIGTNIFDSTLPAPYTAPRIDHVTTYTEYVQNQFGVTIPVDVDYGGNTYQDPVTGETITNDRLTTFSVFDYKFQEILNEPVFSVNKFTVESTANILVRRAVGYAAGLLDYFFRSQIDLTPAPAGGYVIVNNTEEDMTGTFQLYYDNDQGVRTPLWNPSGAAPTFALGAKSSTSAPHFDPPTDAQKPGAYILVFQGTLGAEQGAVVGKVIDLLWLEEWDKGLTGRHPWAVVGTAPSNQSTVVQDGSLTMTNSRPAGTYGAQWNTVQIGTPMDTFPRKITPNTYIRIKVNAMSPNNPYNPDSAYGAIGYEDSRPQGCALNGWFAFDWQVIWLSLSSGGTSHALWVTAPGNDAFNFEPTTSAYVYLTLGSELRVNVYQLFQSHGFPIQDPFELNSMYVEQLLVCNNPGFGAPPSEAEQQSLQMDYISILEESGP